MKESDLLQLRPIIQLLLDEQWSSRGPSPGLGEGGGGGGFGETPHTCVMYARCLYTRVRVVQRRARGVEHLKTCVSCAQGFDTYMYVWCR